ncbi:hypothetical protein [Cohnella abietis]|uniref:Uncharacterized protein n=1 Tax=Cohnella abietis TaxID=2507935 RepID=A0A3T1CY16_9BACL|nr:hypothetical protein [Cohnella abietis]BBI30733.1 hypothetical protein KCTCHS21_01320 [Cohnella abietis]
MRLYCIPLSYLPTGWHSYGFLITAQIDQALSDMVNATNSAAFTVNDGGYHIYRGKNFILEVGEQHAILNLFCSSGAVTVEYRTFRMMDNNRVPPAIVMAFMAHADKQVLLWNLMH